MKSTGSARARFLIAGHRGMVGSALLRACRARGMCSLLLPERKDVDLTRQDAVERYFQENKPEWVVMAAARVGGIHANRSYPAEFAYENLVMASNVVEAARRAGVRRLLFLGSSCIYPKNAAQPMKEDALLSGMLEPTNEAYAIAKIAGMKLCQYYRKQYGLLFHSAMPTNLYGPGDNYHPRHSHVLPALLRRFHEAKLRDEPEVVIWGTGTPRREFLHVDDLADACLHLLALENPPDWVNIGTGKDLEIRELSEEIREVTGYRGDLRFDSSMPDGTPRKLLDVSLMDSFGWKARINLQEGLEKTYASFLEEMKTGTLRER